MMVMQKKTKFGTMKDISAVDYVEEGCWHRRGVAASLDCPIRLVHGVQERTVFGKGQETRVGRYSTGIVKPQLFCTQNHLLKATTLPGPKLRISSTCLWSFSSLEWSLKLYSLSSNSHQVYVQYESPTLA